MGDLLKSKKWLTSVAGTIVGLVGVLGIELPVESVVAILLPICTYVVGQGIADVGKQSDKQVEKKVEEKVKEELKKVVLPKKS